MSAISIGLSGLRVSQRSLDLVGQNIANAQTPGYHRQVPNLAVRAIVDSGEGKGVEVSGVQRNRSGFIENALLTNTSDLNRANAETENARHLESLLAPGEGSVHDQLEKVFNNLQQLAADPGNQAQRRVVLNTAAGLTNQLNDLSSGLAQVSDDLAQESGDLVGQANGLTKRIVDLNQQIQRATVQGINTNDALDQRDQLISELGALVDVRIIPQDYGSVNVVAGGVPVVVGNQATALSYTVDGTTGQGVVTPSGSTTALQVTGGKLAGVLEFRNHTLPTYRGQLDQLANQLARSLDHVQATGLSLQGPTATAGGTRAVNAVTDKLDAAGLAFPPQAGELSVSITAPNGARTLTRITIDPANQSLQDLATALGGIPGLGPVTADTQTNTLQIRATPNYHFDFAGRLSTEPDVVGPYAGTAPVKVQGNFTGAANDTYAYTVVGAGGTVGVTAGLSMQVVRQSDNTVLGTVDLGPGYQVGANTPAIDGVQLQFGVGTLSAGDTFQVHVTADADSAGVLTALGVNTFFSGSDAASLQVRSELLADPQQLATSRNGLPGDGANLERLAAQRDVRSLGNGTQTFREFYAGMVGEVGTQVQNLSDRQTAAQALGQRFQAEQQSVSGVDPNEELLHMLKFQRSFQMSAKYLDVVNRTLDELMQIVG